MCKEGWVVGGYQLNGVKHKKEEIKMELRMNVEGLRFRKADGGLKIADQMRLIGQRLSNSAALRIRAGDNPADRLGGGIPRVG